MRKVKPQLQVEDVPYESPGGSDSIWSDAGVKRAAFHAGHAMGFAKGLSAKPQLPHAPKPSLGMPGRIRAADMEMGGGPYPSRKALDPQEPYPGKGADLVLGAKAGGAHPRTEPKDHWTGAITAGDLDLKHKRPEDVAYAEFGDSVGHKRDPYSPGTVQQQPENNPPQSPYFSNEFGASHKAPTMVVTGAGAGPTSDKDSKMAIKKVKNDASKPGDETDTGDAGGKEQAEAKHGDSEEQRKEHDSQHVPDQSKSASDVKLQDDATHKTTVDEDVKPAVRGMPTPTAQTIPEGKTEGAFQARPPGQGDVPHGNAMGEQPFRLMSDIGVKEGQRAALHSDDTQKLEAVRQQAMREGFMHGHKFAKGGAELPAFMHGHFQEEAPVVKRETIQIAATPAHVPSPMRHPGEWLEKLAHEMPGHVEAHDMDMGTGDRAAGVTKDSRPWSDQHSRQYLPPDKHGPSQEQHGESLPLMHPKYGSGLEAADMDFDAAPRQDHDFRSQSMDRYHGLTGDHNESGREMSAPLARAERPQGDNVDAAMRRVAMRRGY